MNNAILFFYNINIQEIKRINNNYYFTYQQNNYVIYKYNRDISEINEIYELNIELLSKGLIGYEIIPNKTNELIFLYENNYYVLMKIPNIKNKKITYEDILSFNFIQNQNKYKTIDKSNWNQNWSKKIDYIIYQFSQIKNKHKEIDSSIDYFIGIWENAISYYNDTISNKNKKYVAHIRIENDMDLLEYLNPINFVIDYKERDIGEYLKTYVINNNYTENMIDTILKYTNQEGIVLLISRLLFPSYYFDLYENIIEGKTKEEEINVIVKKHYNVLNLIKYKFKKYWDYNIPYINWIKK